MDSSPLSTPKRKRVQLTDHDVAHLDTARFSFDPAIGPEDGSSSPRTRVAHKFRGLVLEPQRSGAPTSQRASGSPEPRWHAPHDQGGSDGDDDDNDPARKRMKLPEADEKPSSIFGSPGARNESRALGPSAAGVGDPQGEWAIGLQAVADDPTVAARAPQSVTHRNNTHHHISANRHGESKSSRKRTGTPPPSLVPAKTKADPDLPDSDPDEPEIVEPIRASLTWHEDEITVYDPDDEDDDGTGINGIGFRPTPAIAYSRMIKRKKQLAEYKKREERDARAKRSQRRRGSPDRTAGGPSSSRKVHFTDPEPKPLATS